MKEPKIAARAKPLQSADATGGESVYVNESGH